MAVAVAHLDQLYGRDARLVLLILILVLVSIFRLILDLLIHIVLMCIVSHHDLIILLVVISTVSISTCQWFKVAPIAIRFYLLSSRCIPVPSHIHRLVVGLVLGRVEDIIIANRPGKALMDNHFLLSSYINQITS